MSSRGLPHALGAVVLVLTSAVTADARQARDPFDRGTVAVEFGGGVLGELWNLNEDRESIVEGVASFWGALADDFSVGIAFHHMRVFQRPPDAFVQGFSPLVRWRFVDRDRWNVFAEIGPGVSWSDLPTPQRGTKFNYLFQGGVGVLRRAGENSHAIAGVRFLHLSNNGREGRERNPDLEMLGTFLGFAFSF